MTISDSITRAGGFIDKVHERSMKHVSWTICAVTLLAGITLALLPEHIKASPTFAYVFDAGHPTSWAVLMGASSIMFALAIQFKPDMAFIPGFILCLVDTVLSVLILLSVQQSHLPLTGVLLVGYGVISGLCALYYTHRGS